MKNYFKDLKDKNFLLSIVLLLGGQSILYPVIKCFQVNYHVFDFALDHMIPFIPPFVIIYNMFYPFLFFLFYYLFKIDKKTYDKTILAGTIGYLICNVIFIIYPVQMIRPDITSIITDPISKLVLEITYRADTPAINCFPSIHCLFCFQAIYASLRSKKISTKYKVLFSIISILIISSIFFIKQHYLVDMLAAFIICILCNLVIELSYNKIKKNK